MECECEWKSLGSGGCGEEDITEGSRDWNSEGREVKGAGGKEGGEEVRDKTIQGSERRHGGEERGGCSCATWSCWSPSPR